MTFKKKLKDCLIASFETSLDDLMAQHGFSRKERSLNYARKYRGATQKIETDPELGPRDSPHAAAAVYPYMHVTIPSIDRTLEEMIGEELGLLAGVTRGLSFQPIEITSQKSEEARWFVFQPDSVPDIVQNLGRFLMRWTLPFLDEFATAEDVVAAYDRADGRIIVDRAQLMRVVAAALVDGRIGYATELMENLSLIHI